jgi:hypothetical protein
MEGVNLTNMHYNKHFCKCHSVPPVQQYVKRESTWLEVPRIKDSSNPRGHFRKHFNPHLSK